MLFFLLINAAFLVLAFEQRVYVLNVKYDNGVITKENIKVISGEASDKRNQPKEGYLLELVSFDETILNSFKFNFPLQIVSLASPDWFDKEGNQIYFPNPEEVGQITLNKTSLQLVVPYFTNGKNINIYNPNGEKVLNIDVRYFVNQSETIFEENQTIKTSQKIQTYFKEDKTGRTIKYIIYFILAIMALILIREGIIKIMGKYRLMKAQLKK